MAALIADQQTTFVYSLLEEQVLQGESNRVHTEQDRWVAKENGLFEMPFIYSLKRSFCQDRLGTNIRRESTQKTEWRLFSLREEPPCDVPRTGEQTPFLRHFIAKRIIVPRQARDTHRENSRKEWRFLRTGQPRRPRGRRLRCAVLPR